MTANDKRLLRRELIAKRDALDEKTRIEASIRACSIIAESPAFERAEKVLLFSPIGSEPDTESLAAAALAADKKIYYPLCGEGGSLSFFEVDSPQELIAGHYNIPEPKPSEKRKLKSAEKLLVIVPAVACDRERFRLGYGGGYYDRFLPKIGNGNGNFMAGLIFFDMLCDFLPHESHDIRLDAVVSEKGIITE